MKFYKGGTAMGVGATDQEKFCTVAYIILQYITDATASSMFVSTKQSVVHKGEPVFLKSPPQKKKFVQKSVRCTNTYILNKVYDEQNRRKINEG
jgi:hypothetical protein